MAAQGWWWPPDDDDDGGDGGDGGQWERWAWAWVTGALVCWDIGLVTLGVWWFGLYPPP